MLKDTELNKIYEILDRTIEKLNPDNFESIEAFEMEIEELTELQGKINNILKWNY